MERDPSWPTKERKKEKKEKTTLGRTYVRLIWHCSAPHCMYIGWCKLRRGRSEEGDRGKGSANVRSWREGGRDGGKEREKHAEVAEKTMSPEEGN